MCNSVILSLMPICHILINLGESVPEKNIQETFLAPYPYWLIELRFSSQQKLGLFEDVLSIQCLSLY